jgi:hypothetical protein
MTDIEKPSMRSERLERYHLKCHAVRALQTRNRGGQQDLKESDLRVSPSMVPHLTNNHIRPNLNTTLLIGA